MIHNITAITFDPNLRLYPSFTVNLNYCKFAPKSNLGAKKIIPRSTLRYL